MEMEWVKALLGGAMIGSAATLMLLARGRVTGISGITYGLLQKPSDEWLGRLSFVMGLIFGGLCLFVYRPEVLANGLEFSFVKLAIAGFLVGYGTVLGNGCTSGHGVCGISRFSVRSMVATMIFMVAGILTVFLVG